MAGAGPRAGTGSRQAQAARGDCPAQRVNAALTYVLPQEQGQEKQ